MTLRLSRLTLSSFHFFVSFVWFQEQRQLSSGHLVQVVLVGRDNTGTVPPGTEYHGTNVKFDTKPTLNQYGRKSSGGGKHFRGQIEEFHGENLSQGSWVHGTPTIILVEKNLVATSQTS